MSDNSREPLIVGGLTFKKEGDGKALSIVATDVDPHIRLWLDSDGVCRLLAWLEENTEPWIKK